MGELQRKLDVEGTPITLIAVHPGMVNTGPSSRPSHLFTASNRTLILISTGPYTSEGYNTTLPSWLLYLTSPFTVTSLQGAFTSLFAATSANVAAAREKYKGKLLVPYGEVTPLTKEARDPVLAKTLWETSERVVREALQRGAN